MKKINKKIGVLDMNIDSIYFLNALRNKFVNDDIYYINDTEIETFDEMDTKEIHNHVSNNINYLLSKNVDIIVVVSDSIVEYCEDLLQDIKIPVVKIVDETIEYVNNNFEYKKMGFLSTSTMIEANIYQKNFRYNHLFNMNGDKLKTLIRTHLVKTSESFQEVKNVIAPVFKKDLDVIIPSLINYLMVKTEINEFLKDVSIIPVDEILCNKVEGILYNEESLPIKGKGKTYVCLNNDQMDLNQLNRLVKVKYQIININDKISK